jgi:hypothetical protein
MKTKITEIIEKAKKLFEVKEGFTAEEAQAALEESRQGELLSRREGLTAQ